MIGKLKGLLEEVAENHILLDVQGVGYLVFISLATRRALPLPGEALSLFIETQMREDALRLFGFFTRAEQEWFRLLQNVQGVGAKLALAILGSLSPDDLAQAILLQDAATICRAPGVGKKMAERLITELKNKIPAAAKAFAPSEKTGAAERNIAGAGLSHNLADAISALANLGYKSDEAARAVAEAAKQEEGGKDTAELIRIGLQILAKKMHNNG